jgi:hypothetical protein
MRSIPAVVPRFTAGGVRHRGGTVEIEAAAGDAPGCRGHHLMSQVPGQGLGKLPGQGGDGGGQSVGDRVGLMVAAGQGHQHQEPGGPFHKGGDWAYVFSEDQVAFPVPGHRPVVCLGWPFGDVQRVRSTAAAVG